MTTAPEPPVDDSYPEAWTPPHIKRRQQEEAQPRQEFDAMSDEELTRIRRGV